MKKPLYFLIVVLILLSGCSNDSGTKDILGLAGHFIESGVSAKDVTGEHGEIEEKLYGPIEKELGIKTRVGYRLIFDEGSVNITVVDVRGINNPEKRLKNAYKKYLGVDDKLQYYTNKNLIMTFDGGEIASLDANTVEIVKTFKSY